MTDTTPRIGRPQMVDDEGVPTRERIIAATLEAIIDKGYDAATLGEIARAAEVSPPAIYNHFGSKSELFVEAARAGMGDVGNGATLRSPDELLEVDAPPHIRHMRRMLVELNTAALRHADLREAMAEWQQYHVDRWVARGHGPEAAARAYFILVQGLALIESLHIDPGDPAVVALVERMREVVLNR